MRLTITTILAIALSFSAFAQNDTMFIHIGQSVHELPAKEVDSVTFYRTKSVVAVEGVSLDRTFDTLNIGETRTLLATVLPPEADNKAVMWVSNNPAVATVKNGLVTAIAPGISVITTVTQEGTHIATCTVIVNQSPMHGGGPYIVYNEDGSVTVISFDKQMNMHTNVYPHRDNINKITVWTHEGDYTFSFDLHETVIPPPARYNMPNRMMVLSDPHGDIVPLVRLLQGNGVINQQLDWSFGDGHLMILGDVQDRGDDQTTIFWLLYKLDAQARKAGGAVHFVLGNHEVMVARNDLRYITPKYHTVAEKVGFGYDRLWSNQTELGRWVNSRNTIIIIGDMLFVHAGIGPQIAALPLTIEQINDTVRKYIALPSSATSGSSRATLIMGSNGPTWYRELVGNTHYEEDVDSILKRYEVEKMIVGHTRVNHVSQFYNQKVIGMDISNVRWTNLNNGRSMGVMITPNSLWAVNANGDSLAFVNVPPIPPRPPQPDPVVTPQNIVTYLQDPAIRSLDTFLNNGSARYDITLMSPKLEAWRQSYAAQFPSFVDYTIRIPRDRFQMNIVTTFDNGAVWYRGPADVAPYQGFFPMTGPGNNPLSDVTLSVSRSSTSGTCPSGYNGASTGAISFMNFLGQTTGFTIIQDGRVFWFRSKADPNDWFVCVRQ